jgi:hypothetical protein
MSPNVAKTSKATDTVASSFEKTHTTLTLALLALLKLKQNDININHPTCTASLKVATANKASDDVTGSFATTICQCKNHFE